MATQSASAWTSLRHLSCHHAVLSLCCQLNMSKALPKGFMSSGSSVIVRCQLSEFVPIVSLLQSRFKRRFRVELCQGLASNTERQAGFQVYRRADVGRKQEEYQLLGTYELEPSSGEITKLFQDNQKQREQQSRAGKAWWQS